MAVLRIALLPGDGVGPEVVEAARMVLEVVLADSGQNVQFDTALVGGAAIEAIGMPLPDETLAVCRSSNAILLGAVGGPQWSDPDAAARPEQAVLELRKRFDLFANLRPIPVFPALAASTPLRPELLKDVDILFVRELSSGLYYGACEEQGESQSAYDTMAYSVAEVERVAHVAFRAARERRGFVTSVDKANVLASMRLWRRTVASVGAQYPDVRLEHRLVDSCAMQLLLEPASFDVVVLGNLFGDILSDAAAVLSGSLGVLPSAALGDSKPGLFEPVHGSAPDLAGRNIANPIGAILSAALLLRHGLEMEEAARRVEKAVAATIAAGVLTPDLAPEGASNGIFDVAQAVVDHLA